MKSATETAHELKLKHRQELQDLLDAQSKELMSIKPTVLVCAWVDDTEKGVIEFQQIHVPADWYQTGTDAEQAINVARATGKSAYPTIEEAWKHTKNATPRPDFDFFEFYDDMVESIRVNEVWRYFYDRETKVITANAYWLATYVPPEALERAVGGYQCFQKALQAMRTHIEGGM